MNFNSGANVGRPIGGYDPSSIMDIDDDQARLAMMRQMGVANVDPPLPHSPCLKNIRTGRVLPWNELLAAQRDLVVCCDEDGNTDEAVWGPKVIKNELSTAELNVLARQQMLVSKESQVTKYEHDVPNPQLNKGPSEYEKCGVISFNDIRRLREELKQ